jgi:hypothetical protein
VNNSRYYLLKENLFFLLVLIFILVACSSTSLQPEPLSSSIITIEPTKRPNQMSSSQQPSPIIKMPTATFVHTPISLTSQTPTIRSELTASDVVFPLSWDGPYAINNKIEYSPCYHFDPMTFDKTKLTEQNWFNYFHAGDMYNLNSSSPAKSYIVLSLSSGKVVNISDSGLENGTMIVVETNHVYEGKDVFFSIAHLTVPFGGDDTFPKIEVGSLVEQGQPLGIQETLYNFGIPEQALDIQFRLNDKAEGFPLDPMWNPSDFFDPYPFLQDDLTSLVKSGQVVFGYNRQHCLLSGHFP